jgi:response regulator RpfG family c-di-GMP phosphodiesterase
MAPSGKKILIVDDEPCICDLLENFLRQKGYGVARADNGTLALSLVEDGDIDLVITDIRMPGMTGIQLLQKIREYNSGIPVLVTTGYPTLDTAVQSLKLGVQDYLTKPFHLGEIGEKVRSAIDRRTIQEEHILFSKLVSLHQVTHILASTLDMAELDRKFLEFSVRFARADGAALFFADASGKLSLAARRGDDFKSEFWTRVPFMLASQRVLDSRQPIAVTGQGDLPAGLKALPAEVGAFISFPLNSPSYTLGVLNLIRHKGSEPFSNLDIEQINVLASQASISIENVRLYHNIRDNYLKTIRAFALAVEAKDEYTHGHSENVMHFTVQIAKHLRMPVHEVEQVKFAGLLHDIGKIGVSESILNKPGKLTPEEFSEIKKHPALGATIIADVPFLKPLVPLVLHHHEFFNGNGYPSGLAGTAIPLGARILSVADAFEAMTSDRPYRKSLPRSAAIKVLEAQSGLQFDPQIVEAFFSTLRHAAG